MLTIPGVIYAQSGTIRGTVIEDATGEPLYGVTVVIEGTTTGQISDFDGAFEIKANPGTYTIQASFVSFKTITITDVVVAANEVTVIDQIRMAEETTELMEVVITAEAIRDSETALVTMKRKSVTVMDGISAVGFKRTGDSDAGEAAQRVTGVSVEGGKYIYVRGLGDRYSKTTMNSVDIPGLDPDRNSIQIDIFPTKLIDNMIILKSFTPELPVDFTGGIVNIETKDFPDERVIEISLKAKYNPAMHFNDSFLTYPGGSKDKFGFDDGTRALPLRATEAPIPSPISGHPESEVFDFLNSFNKNLGAFGESQFMNYNLGLTFANQYNIGQKGRKIGFILTGTYRNDKRFYDDIFVGEYQRPIPEDEYEMVVATTQDGVIAERNVLLGGMTGLALKTSNSRYKLNFMHLQNGESRAAQFELYDNGSAPGKSGYMGWSNNLEYNQRALSNVLLSGAHFNADGSWKVDWRASATKSSLEDPDIRKTAFTITPTTGDSVFFAGAAGNPSRIWRALDEINAQGKIDITREHMLFGRNAKLRFGGSYVFKERDYVILSYDNQFFGRQPDFGGDPNRVLLEENLYPNGTVYFSSANNDPNPNEYNSNVNSYAIYISSEFKPSNRLKAILGVRAENFEQRHTGRDSEYANSETGEVGNNLDNEKVLDAVDFFPSVNFIFEIRENQNLRLAYSRTIARPSFKEMSFAQILDPVTNRIFNGGLFTYNDWDGNLTETRINNFDIRWELFMERAQLFSISGFYKTFDKPIELVRIPAAQTTNEFQPRNVGQSSIAGAELEFRKSLDFISTSLRDLSIYGNFTYVHSSLKMNETEYNSRKGFEKVGEDIKETRDMQGQAPYIVNAGLTYNNIDIGMDAGFFYNVKGRTLTVVGGGLFPDVYSEPFHSLNFNFTKTIGKSQRGSINLSVENILNDKREEFFSAFNAADQIYYAYSPGTEIGLGFSYRF
jgi:TonB-dependent receptor